MWKGDGTALLNAWEFTLVAFQSLTPAEAVQHFAVHEAGHAVVGRRHGLVIIRVSLDVVPTDVGTQAGGAEFVLGPGGVEAEVRTRPLEIGSMCLAGSLAEESWLGGHIDDGYSEDVRIMRVGLGWIEGGELDLDRTRRLSELVSQARRDVRENRDQIRLVANALMQAPAQELSGERVEEILNG